MRWWECPQEAQTRQAEAKNQERATSGGGCVKENGKQEKIEQASNRETQWDTGETHYWLNEKINEWNSTQKGAIEKVAQKTFDLDVYHSRIVNTSRKYFSL